MGATKMGKYDFSSWTLHMASIIIFSTLCGVARREWKGTSRRTHALITFGLAVLVGSTVVIGYGNYLKASSPVRGESLTACSTTFENATGRPRYRDGLARRTPSPAKPWQ
jgi:hypothetical protein